MLFSSFELQIQSVFLNTGFLLGLGIPPPQAEWVPQVEGPPPPLEKFYGAVEWHRSTLPPAPLGGRGLYVDLHFAPIARSVGFRIGAKCSFLISAKCRFRLARSVGLDWREV